MPSFCFTINSQTQHWKLLVRWLHASMSLLVQLVIINDRHDLPTLNQLVDSGDKCHVSLTIYNWTNQDNDDFCCVCHIHGDHSCCQTCESVHPLNKYKEVITSVGVAVVYNCSTQLSSHCSVGPVLCWRWISRCKHSTHSKR